MLVGGRRFPDREWAVEGCQGIGRHIAQRMVADGETVVDVPAKLSARVRALDTGQGRKTDPVDAHSVAVAGLRSPGLRKVMGDDATVALRLLVDRRDELGRARTETVSRLHHLLLELIPGGAKKYLIRGQASYLLRTMPEPVGIVTQTRHQLANGLIEELATIDMRLKAADKQLVGLIKATGSSLRQLNGIGPSGAARLLGDIGDIHRFRSPAHFASWNGTAPLEASSGDHKRHRLPGPATGASTGSCTSWPSSSSVTTPPARLLPPAGCRGQEPDGGHAGPQTSSVRCGLPRHDQRYEDDRGGPGRTHGSDSAIQRGGPNPDGQLFGQVTTRTGCRQA